MKKHLIINAIILVVIVFILCGCTEINQETQDETTDDTGNGIDLENIIGNWRGKGIKYMTFSSDNKCEFSGLTYTWSLDNQQLSLKSSNGAEVIYDYSFSDDYDMLTLINKINQDTDVYTRE